MTTLPLPPSRLNHTGCWPPQPIPGLPKEPTAGDVLRIPRSERNALIAIYLFDWQREGDASRPYFTSAGVTMGLPPAYDTDAVSDRRIFDCVRTSWSPADQQAFTLELYTIWFVRQGKVGGLDTLLCWRVGDCALAVLTVLAQRGVIKP